MTAKESQTTMSKKIKYKLFAGDGDAVSRCAFFASEEGCRSGSNCKFSHENIGGGGGNGNGNGNNDVGDTQSFSSSAPSSESDDIPDIDNRDEHDNEIESDSDIFESPKGRGRAMRGAPDNFAASVAILAAQAAAVAVPDSKSKKKKRSRESIEEARKVDVTPIKQQQQNDNKKTKKSRSSSVTNCDDYNVNGNVFANPKGHTVSNENKTKKTKNEESIVPNLVKTGTGGDSGRGVGFRGLDLPIAPFSVGDQLESIKKSPPPVVDVTSILPRSTVEGRKWLDATIATRAHPRYSSSFNFERFRRADPEMNLAHRKNHWFMARPYGSWCKGNPPAIAIDCEMCETRDPKSNVSDHKALCRISIVNASNHEEVLLDTLVKPDWPVVDDRARINGIPAKALQDVEFTLRHARQFMETLCSDETVIIGHAVHNDLISLKMEHHCCVDSALLFALKDEPREATCSLKELAASVLDREMPNVHDSVNDARVACKSIEVGFIATGGKTELIVRRFATRASGNGNINTNAELFLHRIPRECKADHISKMFLIHSHIRPEKVNDIERPRGESTTGKTTVTFSSKDHAELAFVSIEGDAKPDKTGRMQKRVYLRNGDYVQVRKMTKERQVGTGTSTIVSPK